MVRLPSLAKNPSERCFREKAWGAGTPWEGVDSVRERRRSANRWKRPCAQRSCLLVLIGPGWPCRMSDAAVRIGQGRQSGQVLTVLPVLPDLQICRFCRPCPLPFCERMLPCAFLRGACCSPGGSLASRWLLGLSGLFCQAWPPASSHQGRQRRQKTRSPCPPERRPLGKECPVCVPSERLSLQACLSGWQALQRDWPAGFCSGDGPGCREDVSEWRVGKTCRESTCRTQESCEGWTDQGTGRRSALEAGQGTALANRTCTPWACQSLQDFACEGCAGRRHALRVCRRVGGRSWPWLWETS